MDVGTLLKILPPFQGNEQVIKDQQDTGDIIEQVLNAHELCASDYDLIARFFEGGSQMQILKRLFDFCKKNISYQVEPAVDQTTRTPAGILALRHGDCKHYAGFIAGILDALNRQGYRFNWKYRFAGYKGSGIEHVFVVVNENGKEFWIDPVLKNFDQRYPDPQRVIDKKTSVMLSHLSGIGNSENVAFQSATTVKRQEWIKDNHESQSARACDCGMGLILVPITDARDESGYDNPFEDPYSGGSGGGGGGVIEPPPTVPTDPNLMPASNVFPLPPGVSHPVTAVGSPVGVSYIIDGLPLSFPAKGSYAKTPDGLQVGYPAVWNGKAVPIGMPKPVVVGNRILLLPKTIEKSLLTADDWFWAKFLWQVFTPLINSYAKYPYADIKIQSKSSLHDTQLLILISDDQDYSNPIDYVTGMPTIMPVNLKGPAGVLYLLPDGTENIFPEQNVPGREPPKIPLGLTVVYPKTFYGQPVPGDMPVLEIDRTEQDNSYVRLLFTAPWSQQRVMQDTYFWAKFLTSVMAPLVSAYSKFPYADSENKLAARIVDDVTNKAHINNYLDPPETKTWLGQVIAFHVEYIESVTRGILKFVNAGSRLSFMGLVRINAFAFAYKLFMSYNESPAKRDQLKQRWKDIGGSVGALEDAIILGCKNNPIFGGGVKQWIEDAVQDGILDNGYTRPANDEAIPDGNEIPEGVNGFSIGVVGADDVVYYMAAASAVIGALATFLKGIGGPQTDKIVDDTVNGINVLLAAADEDPIGLGGELGIPTTVIDPNTGKQYTLPPPPKNNTGVLAWIKANPMQAGLIGAAAVGGIYLVTAKGKKKRLSTTVK